MLLDVSIFVDVSKSSLHLNAIDFNDFHLFMMQTSERTLDAPDIVDDYYLNLLDWGSGNVLSIALGNTVYLWDASNGSTSELVTIDDENGPVTSVKWAPDGRHLAVGLNNSEVQLWDSTANRLVCSLNLSALFFVLKEKFFCVCLDWSLILFTCAILAAKNFERRP